jgi:HEPN domain-containing protein
VARSNVLRRWKAEFFMPLDDRVLRVVKEWIGRAEGDFKAATLLLASGESCPTEAVCFHAQQCVEKYVKAALVKLQIDFPKTHDLERLAKLLPHGVSVSLSAAERVELTQHGVVSRYPGSGEIPFLVARRAVTMARKARKALRAALPLTAKRRARGRTA